jgi:hypothetical protein
MTFFHHSTPEQSPKLAVVVATNNRLHLLSERSLPSVIAQTHRPDFLIIVDDSPSEIRPLNAQFVASLTLSGCQITYLENKRTGGASGSWNTALDFLFNTVDDPNHLFVAILDDDDSWSSTYLENCLTAVKQQQLDMIAADLYRFESLDEKPVLYEAPTTLQIEDFLVGNPGIQGSNLFLRLSLFLAAGGFDEALTSTTDRDLCIRIAELGLVRYGRLEIPQVNHFADANRTRLSTPGSQAKTDGLTSFWKKYIGRMTANQREAFSDRATKLFGWHPPNETVAPLPSNTGSKKAVVLGLVVDNEHPDELLRIVHRLASWRDESVVGLDIALLEQGLPKGELSVLNQATELLRNSGVGCFRFPVKQQHKDARTELFSPHISHPERLSPKHLKAMLQAYCSRIANTRTGTEVWLATNPERKNQTLHGTQVSDLLHWLRARRIDNFKHTAPRVTTALDQWIQSERIATAKHRVKRHFFLERVRLLGCGSEAVVLTDEHTVYKCIDYWKTRMPHSQLDFLRSQTGRWTNTPGLYVLRDIVEDGPWAVLTYDYEKSSPYEGGYEADLLRLLDGCCAMGVVCNNIHPKNLIVTASGVKLIDYGSDIRPWSPLGFEHMARRAFLTCRHARHPDLQSLMRRVLTNHQLPEMVGYSSFRACLNEEPMRFTIAGMTSTPISKAPPHQPIKLYTGVITSDPSKLKPLLQGLSLLQDRGSQDLAVLVLNNGSSPAELTTLVRENRKAGLKIAVVDEAQQRLDAKAGAFGTTLRNRPLGQVGIAMARTMLQRYLGALLPCDNGSFGWILDDDMRIDAQAQAYLSWLPEFREQGVDVLIGAYEGASPNPPLNGLRVHLVDLLHNLHWLRGLPRNALLPDRGAENAVLRTQYPDYYYDLSRKHTGHLEMPHWLEPAFSGETVKEAYSRLLAGALGILSGAPLTRPIITNIPLDPLSSAKDSVNRGGTTFILNHHALSQTPNTIIWLDGREARRSDMVWAIVNRYYHRMNIKAVGFPVHHVGRVTVNPDLNVEKIQGEIIGSTLYAGITEFLGTRPHHKLDFSSQEAEEIRCLANLHLTQRWQMLEQNFQRITGLREAIRRATKPRELEDLIGYLERWFTPKSFYKIRSGVEKHDSRQVEDFLVSLCATADDFATKTVNIDFIKIQLGHNISKKEQ